MDTPKKNTMRAVIALCGTVMFLSTTPAFAAPLDTDVTAETAMEDNVSGEMTTAEETAGESVTAAQEENGEDATAEAPTDETDALETAADDADQGNENDADENEEDEEDEEDDAEPTVSDTYTAPENISHVNVSFKFTNASGGKPVYPVTMELKEVDTKVKKKIVLRSAGQIVELEHGDYKVVSFKDSGKMPLVASDETLSLYSNTSYTIRYAQNRLRKTIMDFLKDNILLAVMFVGAAAIYNATIIKNFNKHPRR